MEVSKLRIEDLIFDARNARQHPERQILALCESLKRFGQRRPAVVRRTTLEIIAGNGMVEAARRLGWAEVDAMLVDDDADAAAAFALADNKIFDLGKWDEDALSEIASGIDPDVLSAIGYSEEEITGLLGPPEEVESGAVVKEPMFGGINGTAPKRKNIAVTLVIFTDDADSIHNAITMAVKRGALSRGSALAEICSEWARGRK